LDIEQKVLSLLRSVPLDRYSIYKMIPTESKLTLSKAINNLQQQGQVHVVKYRRDRRTGISIPLYSVHPNSEKDSRLHPNDVFEGMTPDRYAEYDFVLRNLIPLGVKAKILDVGCSTLAFSSKISNLSRNRCEITGIDIVNEVGSQGFPLILMDAMSIGFKDNTFDQVICLSSMEHIGFDHGTIGPRYKDLGCRINGDVVAMKEIWRVLKDKGTLILTVPYGRLIVKQLGYRIYHQESLTILTNMFFTVKKEFFGLKSGKWTECNELEANDLTLLDYSNQKFHSEIIACLLLEKKNESKFACYLTEETAASTSLIPEF
jgi:SAM-dependent methyltransferase